MDYSAFFDEFWSPILSKPVGYPVALRDVMFTVLLVRVLMECHAAVTAILHEKQNIACERSSSH
jgi:hypothetical protein